MHGTGDVLSAKQEAAALEKWRRLLIVSSTLLVLIALAAGAVRLGMAIHHTLLLFSLGGLVGYAIEPLVALVQNLPTRRGKKPLKRTLSVLLVFLGLFLIFAAGVWWLGDQAVHQVKILQHDFPMYRDRAFNMARQVDEGLLRPRGITFSVEDTLRRPPPEANVFAERASREALPFLAHTLTLMTESAVVLLIALYLLIFGSEMKERANKVLSPYLRSYAIPWETDVDRILGGFVRGQLVLALIYGACTAVGLLLMGVHLWLIISLFVIVASLIPVFGPYIAAVPAVLAALVTPTHFTPVAGAIAVLALFVVINEVGSKVLYPKLVGNALGLHEVVVLFVLFAGLEVDGIVGTLFAAPVASLGIVTIVHLYRLWQERPDFALADEFKRSAEKR